MNLKRLEVFVAVADTGSFSRAAEATHITQSTVSQHIITLEEEFGLKLLDRTGKGVFPTEAGKILLGRAKRILADATDLAVSLKRLRGIEEAVLSVGASNIPGTYLVPDMLPVFSDTYPGVTVSVRHADSTDIVQMLQQEEVEIGVVGSRFEGDACDFVPFGADELVLGVASRHPFAGRKITIDEFLAEPYLAREKGSGTEKTVTEALLRAGVDLRRLRVKVRLGSNEAVKRGIANGLGVAFISEMSIKDEMGRGDMAVASVTGLAITRQFFLATRRKRELSPPAAAFRELLLKGGSGRS